MWGVFVEMEEMDIVRFLEDYKALCQRHGLYFEAGDEELIVCKVVGPFGPYDQLYVNGVCVQGWSENENHTQWLKWPED